MSHIMDLPSKKLLIIFITFLLISIGIGSWLLISNNLTTINALIDAYQQLSKAHSFTELVINGVVQVVISLCGILPASGAAFGSGMLYGLWKGFLLSASTAFVAAIISFCLSRSILRPSIQKFLKQSARMQRLDHLFYLDGWKLVCLLRISPIMPFALTSYALGLTSISFRSYLIGTLASLPTLFAYVLMGYIASNEATNLQTQSVTSIKHILLLIAFVGTGILIWHLSKIIHKIMKIPDTPTKQ